MKERFNQHPQSQRALFKAIDTLYDSCKFRSRLEARYAVFFKTLGVEYHYEAEGYNLEGTPYLPDFYLPKQDCFVEIKGVNPTHEEVRKIKLLSLYTNKPAYLFAGDIHEPRDERIYSYGYRPPVPYTCLTDLTEVADYTLPPHIIITLQKLLDGGMCFHQCDMIEDYHLHQYQSKRAPEDGGISEYGLPLTWEEVIRCLQDECQDGSTGLALLHQHMNEIIVVDQNIRKQGKILDIFPQNIDLNATWCECPTCKMVGITQGGRPFLLTCGCIKYGDQANTPLASRSPRLLQAYAAARQARFDKGMEAGR